MPGFWRCGSRARSAKPVERRVEDPRAEPRLDDLGNQLEPTRQAEVRILGAGGLRLRDLLEALARVVGRQRAAPEEPEQRVVARPVKTRDRVERFALRAAVARRAAELETVLLQADQRWDLGPLRFHCEGRRPAADVQRLDVLSRLARRLVERAADPAGVA